MSNGGLSAAVSGVWYKCDESTSRAVVTCQEFACPDKRVPFQMSVRNLTVYRDPATILIDQFREIYLDGELELTRTATWVPKLIKQDYVVGPNVLGTATDDPDVVFLQNHVYGSARNFTGHCDPARDQKMIAQSEERDPPRRRLLVREIDQAFQEQLARPALNHRRGGTRWQPRVKGLTVMVNRSTMAGAWRMSGWIERPERTTLGENRCAGLG